jgi:hypothetical protein
MQTAKNTVKTIKSYLLRPLIAKQGVQDKFSLIPECFHCKDILSWRSSSAMPFTMTHIFFLFVSPTFC